MDAPRRPDPFLATFFFWSAAIVAAFFPSHRPQLRRDQRATPLSICGPRFVAVRAANERFRGLSLRERPSFRGAKKRTFAERTATYRENPASKCLTAFPHGAGTIDRTRVDCTCSPVRFATTWLRKGRGTRSAIVQSVSRAKAYGRGRLACRKS